MRRAISRGLVVGAVLVGLGGCGYRTSDRALSGGLIGAGGGAAIAGISGGNPLAGAAIGGAAGALGGALTSPNTLNLGRPVWR
jgi:osmotically inducible lipoprotein OsmB